MDPSQPNRDMNGTSSEYQNYIDPPFVSGHGGAAATQPPSAPRVQQSPNNHQNNRQTPGNANSHIAYARYPYLNPPVGQRIQQGIYQPSQVPILNYSAHTPGSRPQLVSAAGPSPGPPHRVIHDSHSSASTTVSRDMLSVSPASHYSNDSKKATPTTTNATSVEQFEPAVATASNSPADTRTKHIGGRKRSSTACDKCRQKKIKCDNVKPRCGSCIRNGISDCHYSAEGSAPDIWLSDMAYSGLSAKLDLIMNELQSRAEPENMRPRKKRKISAADSAQPQHWDASFTNLIKWPYLQKQLGIDPEDTSRHIGRILSHCDASNLPMPRFGNFQEHLDACTAVEDNFHEQFPALLNAFLINSHTKVPILDIVGLIESLEIATLIRRADESVTLTRLLQEYYSLKTTQPVGSFYSNALTKLNVEDSQILQKAYRVFCESVPVILMVCAIGIISTPVSLDNIGTYENSLEERSSSMSQKAHKLENARLPQDRFSLSQSYVNYASLILSMFPQSLRPYSMVSVKYHVLLSQYNHYTLNPTLAHENITIASNHLAFHIERHNSRAGLIYKSQNATIHDDALINRLYWTCLKLECEMRVELSPFVPHSAITSISPPSSFFRMPDPFQESEHTSDSIKLADKYDDQNTWYYFLTEIAVRKVENNMLDEVYPSSQDEYLWEDPDFFSDRLWRLTIKYLNQLNGIVDSLTPAIRNFVVSETDPAQIYASIKRKAARRKKQSVEDETVPQILEDVLVDEDLIHQAQSESVMFIKTRILSSRLMLMRPLVYMYLHDHISFGEIMEAAIEVLQSQFEQSPMNHSDDSRVTYSASPAGTGSEGSIYRSAAALNFLDNDDDDSEYNFSTPSSGFTRKKSKIDDFSDLAEYAERSDSDQDSRSTMNVGGARKRILKWFVGGLIAIPKLNMPKIGLFRHPGSWYYIRNLILGMIMQFLIYKKTQAYVVELASEQNGPKSPNTENLKVLSSIFEKEKIQHSLEHALLIADYWKDERQDCTIYGEYLRQCLDRL